ncbi:unnamed protein product [Rotaria magnacalcarata]
MRVLNNTLNKNVTMSNINISLSFITKIQFVTFQMTYYGPIILLIIGIFGCSCNFLTFTSRKLRKNSCAFYFLCSTIFEFLTISFGLTTRLAADHFHWNLQNKSRFFCKFRAYYVSTVPLIATYLILLSALDRCTLTSVHVRLRSLSQIKIAYRNVLIVIIIGLLSCSHILFSYDLRSKCATLPGMYTIFDGMFVVFWLGFIPHGMMLIFAFITLMNIRRARQQMTIRPIMKTMHINQKQSQHNHKTNAQLVLMMLVQIGLSSLLILTRMIYYAYYIVCPLFTGDAKALGSFLMSFTTLLYYANYVKSFYIYTLTMNTFYYSLYGVDITKGLHHSKPYTFVMRKMCISTYLSDMPNWNIRCLKSDNGKILSSILGPPNTSSTMAVDIRNTSSPITPHTLHSAKGRTTIELAKKDGYPLGLTISGGIDKVGKPRVAQLKPGSIAQKSDMLEIGDILIGINGIKTAGLKHEQVIDLIKQVGDQLILDIDYELPKWPIHAINTVHTKTIQIQLEKEGQSYGFILRGGDSDDKVKARPLIITRIRSQGTADREGTLKIGDRVLAINGINVSGASLQDAHQVMKQCRGTTLFLIEYDVAIVDSIKHASGPLLIEIEKSFGSTIGISLAQKWTRNNHSIIVIDNVKPASIADRCGALHCGDQINAIDDKSFTDITLVEANTIIQSCKGDFCRIEVTPASVLTSMNIIVDQSQNRVNENNHQAYYRSPIQTNNWTLRNNYQHPTRKQISKARHSSISLKSLDNLSNEISPWIVKAYNLLELGSLNSSYQTVLSNHMCHTEIMECILQFDSLCSNRVSNDGETMGCYGFTIQGASFASEALIQSPIIGYLEPNGLAERSGILQPGDRILAINGQQLEGMTLEDARSIVKRSNHQVHLEVEFDVADSVMLTSGICEVKLLRKNLDLGLSMTYSRSSHFDEIPIISDVKRGSVAYRCGMIQPGDHLLSIDLHSLRGKSLNEVASLLKNCDDIVRLRIKKDDIYSQDNLCENVVVYKVQLHRQGGPLGLTIAGSEDVFEPIIVSDLCEGGLADKTNAIHIGDRILAINDVSLRGKGLNEAIKLLQSSGDEITLKISRILNQQQNYTPSVDSAMESWDSSNTDNRLSDNSDATTTKEIIVNDHQHYQIPNSNGNDSDFVLKHQLHSIPVTTNTLSRSIVTFPIGSDYRTPTTNGRLREPIRQLEHERHISSITNDKSIGTNIYENKYDNYGRDRLVNDTVTVVLKRDRRILDFGFSISDRLYGTGVYINKIRPNGPAELERTLIPCMRIYKVNNIDVTLVGRRPAPMFDETDELFHTDENEDEHQSASIADEPISENQMSTINDTNIYSRLSQSKTSVV